jgi:hypothetical protein
MERVLLDGPVSKGNPHFLGTHKRLHHQVQLQVVVANTTSQLMLNGAR